MSRYIDAEKIKYTEYINGDVTVSKDLVEKIPTADVVEVKHGHWIFEKDIERFGIWDTFICSKCGCREIFKSKYCPHCGAKMDEEEKNVYV